MSKWSVIQHRNYNDFIYGSFDIYLTEHDIVIRGRLKKTKNNSLYMTLKRMR
jgi:hypothetical protein